MSKISKKAFNNINTVQTNWTNKIRSLNHHRDEISNMSNNSSQAETKRNQA